MTMLLIYLLTIISHFVFIEYITHALMGHIRNPDTPDAKPMSCGPQQYFVP